MLSYPVIDNACLLLYQFFLQIFQEKDTFYDIQYNYVF